MTCCEWCSQILDNQFYVSYTNSALQVSTPWLKNKRYILLLTCITHWHISTVLHFNPQTSFNYYLLNSIPADILFLFVFKWSGVELLRGPPQGSNKVLLYSIPQIDFKWNKKNCTKEQVMCVEEYSHTQKLIKKMLILFICLHQQVLPN